MPWQRTAVVLTVLNLVLLMFVLAQVRPLGAEAVSPVLRCRALELLDDRGRVRAEIKVQAYVQVLSRGGSPLIKIVNKDGVQQLVKP